MDLFIYSLYFPFQYKKGADEVFGFIKKTTSYGIEKKLFTLHIDPELHTLMNPSMKISFGCAENASIKIGNRSQRLISTPTCLSFL
jgi:hypothetical protein